MADEAWEGMSVKGDEWRTERSGCSEKTGRERLPSARERANQKPRQTWGRAASGGRAAEKENGEKDLV